MSIDSLSSNLNHIQGFKYVFCIENTIRVGMHSLLASKYGPNYFNAGILKPFTTTLLGKEFPINVVELVSKFEVQKQSTSRSDIGSYPKLWYLEFPILLCIVIHYHDSVFEQLYEKPKHFFDRLSGNLTTLRDIRNNIAHNRDITFWEVKQLEEFADLLRDHIKASYIKDYELLVFSKSKDYSRILNEICNLILSLLNSDQLIKSEFINRLNSIISFISQVEANRVNTESFDLLLEDLKKYNSIRRVPGNREIQDFTKEKNLKDRISSLL